jgi:hypothetical protein
MPELMQKPKFVFDKIAKGSLVMQVVDFLIQNPDKDFTISEISDGAEVGRTTLWDGLLDFMLNEGLIIKTRTIGNAKLYRLNINDEKVKALIKLHKLLGEKQNV